MTRTIMHLDLDAFFCAVEELHRPELKGKAFAVGGRPEERGVVASCSYAARHLGVHSAMPMSQAIRLCPSLIIVSHSGSAYSEFSRKVMERLNNLAPLVEQISIDEAFIDISDMSASPLEIARGLQKQILDELGLPCSVGVASNKLVAKIATETGKKAGRGAVPGYPFGLTLVPPGEEATFLAPMPVSMLWGVGPKTEARLAQMGIQRIGQLALLDEILAAEMFGENGREMVRHARGEDNRPVVTDRATKSISQETTFVRDVRNDVELEATLKELSAQVGKNMRKEQLIGRTIKIKLRWPDFTTISRQATIPATNLDDVIFDNALILLRKVRASGQAVRLIGVGMSNLGPPVRQMELWGQESEKAYKLQDALDSLQNKYGHRVVRKGK